MHITIDCPSKDHRLRVKTTQVVDSILESHSENLPDPTKSSCYEPAFIIGKDITLNQGKTFAECGINHGDTLYQLLEVKKYILIRNEFTGEDIRIAPVPFRCTVGDLVDGLHRTEEFHVRQLPVTKLVLKSDTCKILDKDKTLVDYNIKNDHVLYLCKNYIEFNIRVPEYGKMEQVLFKPGITIANFKNDVKEMMPDVDYTTGIREVYPVGLRGALKNTTGATFFLYLSLFTEKMYLILIKEGEGNAGDVHSGCYLDNEYTVHDIWRIIRREYRTDERIIPSLSSRGFPKPYSYNRSWMKTFAPQIQIEPLSSNASLPFFFFPLRTRIMDIQLNNDDDPLTDVRKFSTMVCENRLNLKGVKRSLYHTSTNKPLRADLLLNCCHDLLLSNAVVVTKLLNRGPIKGPIKESARIVVWVRWRTRIGLPPVSIQMESTDTINALRDEIESDLEVPFSMQKLILDGKTLLNGSGTLGEEGIKNGSTVDLEPVTNFELVPPPP